MLRFLLLALLILTACQPDAVLPTLANLDEVMPPTATATMTETPMATPTPEALSRAATLPPTFTPTDTPLPPPENTPIAQAQPRTNIMGTLYYLYNDDAIVAISADGTQSDIVVTFGVGQMISDLVLSPDAGRFAFVAPAGSAREIYISDLAGNDVRRISCLGFSDVRQPIWSSDGETLVFYAAPSDTAPGNIYRVNVEGNCPSGNAQGVLVPVNAPDFAGMTWNREMRLLFYGVGDGPIYARDMTTGETIRYTVPGIYGPDALPLQNPVTDEMAYLISIQNRVTGRIGGGLAFIADSTFVPDRPISQNGVAPVVHDMRWSLSGEFLLLMTPDSIAVTTTGGRFRIIAEDLQAPRGAISPNDAQVAYTQFTGADTSQIFVRGIDGRGDVQQITDNPDGIINDVIWVPDA